MYLLILTQTLAQLKYCMTRLVYVYKAQGLTVQANQ